MKKISQKVKTKIIVIVSLILGYSVVFMLLFECFFIHRDLEKEYPGFDYGSSVFFEGVFHPFFGQATRGDSEFVLMFRWKYDELIEEMKFNVYRELKLFLEDNKISDFDVDEQKMNVDMTVNKMTENKRKSFYLSIEEIQDTCSLWYIFKYKKLPEKSQAEVRLYDADGNQIQDVSAEGCVRIWSKGEILHQDGVDMEEPPIPSDEEIEEIKQKAKENKNRIDE